MRSIYATETEWLAAVIAAVTNIRLLSTAHSDDVDSVGVAITANIAGDVAPAITLVGTINSGSLVVGRKYRIADNTGLDVTNVGAANNNVGTIFTATGAAPTAWGTGSLRLHRGLQASADIEWEASGANLSIRGWELRDAGGNHWHHKTYAEAEVVDDGDVFRLRASAIYINANAPA